MQNVIELLKAKQTIKNSTSFRWNIFVWAKVQWTEPKAKTKAKIKNKAKAKTEAKTKAKTKIDVKCDKMDTMRTCLCKWIE